MESTWLETEFWAQENFLPRMEIPSGNRSVGVDFVVPGFDAVVWLEHDGWWLAHWVVAKARMTRSYLVSMVRGRFTKMRVQ